MTCTSVGKLDLDVHYINEIWDLAPITCGINYKHSLIVWPPWVYVVFIKDPLERVKTHLYHI